MTHEPTMVPYEDLTPQQRAEVDSPSRVDRTYAAVYGLGLDKLASDPDWQVREEVANRGYALDVLASDEHPLVRAAVAAQGITPDIFAKDPAWECRYAVAKRGYVTPALLKDPDPYVQKAAKDAAAASRGPMATQGTCRIPVKSERRRTPAFHERDCRAAASAMGSRAAEPRRSHALTV